MGIELNSNYKLNSLPRIHYDIVSIMIKATTSEEKEKENFNNSGFLLEDAVFQKLSSDDRLTVYSETPFSLPEYKKRGTIDILCISHIQNSINIICAIECKKSFDQEKIWLFKPDSQEDVPEIEGFFYDNKTHTHIYTVSDLSTLNDLKYYSNCLQYHPKTGALSRNQVERAYTTMISPNESTSSFINQFPSGDFIKKYNLQKESHFILVPIVCTNAKLKIAKYDKDNIALSSGEIKHSDIQLEEVTSVFYKFPMGYGISPAYTGYNIEKRLTIVVNSEGIGVLMDYLLKTVPSYLSSRNKTLF